MTTTLPDLLAKEQRALEAAEARIRSRSDRITQIRNTVEADNRELTEAESDEVRALVDELDDLKIKRAQVRDRVSDLEVEVRVDQRLDEAARQSFPVEAQRSQTGSNTGGQVRELRTGSARVLSEPRTYTQQGDRQGVRSFFADTFSATVLGDVEARSRIERHQQEMRVDGRMTERATTTTSFAGLVVPQYLTDQAALVARAGRPFANSLNTFPLPDQGMTFQVPKGTTGASAAVQATENSSVSSTDEVWGNVSVPVVTIAGQQDVSRQSLERGTPGLDQLIYMDLAGAYSVALDAQTLSGTGSSGQMLGVLNTAGINQATAFTAAATVATFYTKLAGQLNAIETTRFMAPTAIVMHPRRWNWLISQTDSTTRPLVVPAGNGPFNAVGTYVTPIDTPSVAPVGSLMGLPVITDASVPTAVGTGPEDQVIVYRREDLLLWEDGDGMPRQLRFEQTLGNQLTVKVVAYGYAAFTAARYPTAVGIVGGNAASGFGLIAPTF